MKNKIIMILAVILLLIAVIIIGRQTYVKNKVIGYYYGTEYEFITVDGVDYEADYDNSYSASDRKSPLGKVTFRNASSDQRYDPMYIWSVRGTDEYIYAGCVYDGTFYKKKP